MEFLTEENIAWVPPDHIESLLLTVKQFLTQTQVSAQTFLSLLGKLSAAADLVVQGRLHLRLLQISLETSYFTNGSSSSELPITNMIRFHLKW